MVLIGLLLIGLNLAVIASFLFILVISLAAIFSRRERIDLGEPRSRFLIVIPAHDEELSVATTVKSCLAANYPSSLFGVTVIADNCSDQTASVAAGAGARVVARFDPDKRSKGYAIEFLIEELIRSGEFDALDALVIVDADTTIDPDLLRCFDQVLLQGRDWIQCYYTLANPDQSFHTRLLTYAFGLINGVVLLGQNALGLSAGLRGNGMCLSRRGLKRVPWKAHGLTEDIEYSWKVRIAGGWIGFTPDAAVYALMPAQGGAAAAVQQQRWEAGRRSLQRTMLGPLWHSSHLRIGPKAAALLELTMPTTVYFVLLYTLLSLLALFWLPRLYRIENYVSFYLIALFQTIMTLGLLIYVASPFILSLVPWRFALSLIHAPRYAIWKMGIRARGHPPEWQRTPREPSDPPRNAIS
jgi:cellulose synthase/poly-beta-1,6-N-acetylglucosamine synthase-like glycosyltransferase